jgi:hypothetical protein
VNFAQQSLSRHRLAGEEREGEVKTKIGENVIGCLIFI